MNKSEEYTVLWKKSLDKKFSEFILLIYMFFTATDCVKENAWYKEASNEYKLRVHSVR